jgi:hypothetical protein
MATLFKMSIVPVWPHRVRLLPEGVGGTSRVLALAAGGFILVGALLLVMACVPQLAIDPAASAGTNGSRMSDDVRLRSRRRRRIKRVAEVR